MSRFVNLAGTMWKDGQVMASSEGFTINIDAIESVTWGGVTIVRFLRGGNLAIYVPESQQALRSTLIDNQAIWHGKQL